MKIIEEPHIEYAIEIGVSSAKYISEYKLQLIFGDDFETVVDFEEFLTKSQHHSIRKYLNLENFKQFKIVNGNLNWNDYDMLFPLSDLKKGTIS